MVKCGICGARLSCKARRMSSSRNQNAVLLMSLALAGYIEAEHARGLVEPIIPHGLYLCDDHFVQAAQFISAEMEVMGMGLAQYNDPSSSIPTVYVSNGEIPQHLIDTFNRMATNIAVVTSVDVRDFMNFALKRFYSTELWRLTEQIFIARDKLHECGFAVEDSKAAKQEPTAGDKMCSGKGDVTAEDSYKNGDTASNESFQVMEHETKYRVPDHERNSKIPDSVPADDEEMDETTTDKFFIVQGPMLMSLFRFCPHCGHRLDKVQLKAVGTAAVVRFKCHMCPANKWESRERVVELPGARISKGNVTGAASAVTTGVRHERKRRLC